MAEVKTTVRQPITTNGRDPFQNDEGQTQFTTYETTPAGWIEIEKQNKFRPNHLKHVLVKAKDEPKK